MNNKLRKIKKLYLNAISNELKKNWNQVIIYGGIKTLNMDLFDDKSRRHVWMTYSLKENDDELVKKSENLSDEELSKIEEPIKDYISDYFTYYAKPARMVATYGEKGASIYKKKRK